MSVPDSHFMPALRACVCMCERERVCVCACVHVYMCVSVRQCARCVFKHWSSEYIHMHVCEYTFVCGTGCTNGCARMSIQDGQDA